MTYAEAAILGVVQGLTEFLPISSSGHLCLAQHVLKIGGGPEVVTFDIALHVASLAAILLIFAPRIKEILMKDHRVIGLLVVASIPAAVGYKLLKHQLEGLFDRPDVVAGALLVTGACLLVADHLMKKDSGASPVATVKSSVFMGVLQAFAMVPGLSRSGLTITAGLAGGLQREKAYEFSFLMAIPAIGGAAIFKLDELNMNEIGAGPLGVGLLLAFVFSIIGLLTLKKLMLSQQLKWVGVYCVVVGFGALLFLR